KIGREELGRGRLSGRHRKAHDKRKGASLAFPQNGLEHDVERDADQHVERQRDAGAPRRRKGGEHETRRARERVARERAAHEREILEDQPPDHAGGHAALPPTQRTNAASRSPPPSRKPATGPSAAIRPSCTNATRSARSPTSAP